MEIIIDSREKARVIGSIVEYFDLNGIIHETSKLPVGDYMSLDNARKVIDRKHNLQELAVNCSDPDIKRFRRELETAQRLGIKLIILCEHSNRIKCLEDVIEWVNPVCKKHPIAMSGERLYKVLYALKSTYGIEIYFCDKKRTGSEIVRLLSEP